MSYLCEVVDKAIVKVLSSQVGVSSCGSHFKDTLLDGEKGDIKGSATQVKDEHVLLFASGIFLVQPVGNSCSGGLIDDTQHIQTSNDTWTEEQE